MSTCFNADIGRTLSHVVPRIARRCCSSTLFWTVRSTKLRRRDSGLRLQGPDGVSGRRFEDSGSARHVCQCSRLGCEGQGSGGPFHQELHEVHGQRGRQGACCRRSEVVIAGCGLFRTEPRTGRMECHPPRFFVSYFEPCRSVPDWGAGGMDAKTADGRSLRPDRPLPVKLPTDLFVNHLQFHFG